MTFLVLSRDECQYCDLTVSLLTTHAKTFEVHKCADGRELRRILADDYGMIPEHVTFPQIFCNGKHVGGYSELHKYILNEFGTDADF
jgi:glutaredoxin